MELDFGDPSSPKYGHHHHYPGGGPSKELVFDHELASIFKSKNKSLHALEFYVEHVDFREYLRVLVRIGWEYKE